MELKDVLAALEALENGAALIETVKAELSKKNKEAQTLRKRAKDAEDELKKEKSDRVELMKKLGYEDAADEGFDFEAAIDETLGKLEAAGNEKNQTDKDVEKLQNDLKKVQREIAKANEAVKEKESALAAEIQKRHSAMINTAVLKELAAGNALKPEFLATALAGKVKVGDNDELIFTDDSGEEVSVSEGIQAFLKASPEFVSNHGSGGSGGAPGAGGSGDESVSVKIAEQRNKGQQQVGAGGYNPWAASNPAAQ